MENKELERGLKMKGKKLYAIILVCIMTLMSLSSRATAEMDVAADESTPVHWVFDSVPDSTKTQEGITYVIYGNTEYQEGGSLKMTADQGGAGWTLGEEAKAVLKDYPLVLEEQLTMGDTKQCQALLMRNQNSQELLGIYPDKWRIFKWTKESSFPPGASLTGRIYTIRLVVDYPNNSICMTVSENAAGNETILEASLSTDDADVFGGEFADGVSLIQMYGTNQSVINYARIGFIATAPEVKEVKFGDTPYVDGTPVSRETTKITIPVSCPLDSESLNGQISLKDSNNQSVSVNASYDAEQKALVIMNGRLRKTTEYTLTLGEGIKNTLGTPIAEPYSLTFITDDSGETISPSITLAAVTSGLSEGDSLTITPTVSGGESDIVSVEYFDNGVSIGTETDFPYIKTIASIAGGRHTIYATVTNAEGERVDSSELSFFVNKYITEVMADEDSMGISNTFTGDLIKIEHTVTITADKLTKAGEDYSAQGAIKTGDANASDYIYNLWNIYSPLSTSFGRTLENGDTVVFTIIVDTSVGKIDVYCDDELIKTVNDERSKRGIVRYAEQNGIDGGLNSHIKMMKLTVAAMPSELVFKKQGAETVYGLTDADEIEIMFNKELTEIDFEGKVTLTDEDGKTIACSGEYKDGKYVLRPAEVLENAKYYTITFRNVAGMSGQEETIGFTARSAFELKNLMLSDDGTAHAAIVNNTDIAQEYTLFAAVYDSTGKVLNYIGFENGTIAANTSEVKRCSIEGYTKQSRQKVVFMLWDSIQDMTPLCIPAVMN